MLLTGGMLGQGDYDALLGAIKVGLAGHALQAQASRKAPAVHGQGLALTSTACRLQISMQAQTGTGVRLWVAVPHIDWGYMTVGGGADSWGQLTGSLLRPELALARGARGQRCTAFPRCLHLNTR